MKAVRMVAVGQPLELHELPAPAIGPRDVLVRVRAAGICHSYVHYRAGKSPVRPLPLTLGHEIAGVVEQIGPQVGSLQVGDRVCLHYLLSCGDCYYLSVGIEQFCGVVTCHLRPAAADSRPVAVDVYEIADGSGRQQVTIKVAGVNQTPLVGAKPSFASSR